MSERLCDKCGKGPATVHVTETGEGRQPVERHLCKACAEEERAQLPGLVAAETVLDIATPPPDDVCERCRKRPATVQAILIVKGEVQSLQNLCEECGPRTPGGLTIHLGQEAAAKRPVGEEEPSLAATANEARAAVLESAEVKRRFAEYAAADIARAVHIVAACLRAGHKVLLCGNGGSAAEAQHIAAELVGRFKLERPAFAAIALTTNSSILTAIANDYSFDDVFARAVQGLGAPGDVLFAYSTSGNSPNVLKAIEAAKTLGISTIGFTGSSGGRMAALCDLCIKVPSDDTPTVQECHTAAGHTICRLVERLLCQ